MIEDLKCCTVNNQHLNDWQSTKLKQRDNKSHYTRNNWYADQR